MASNVNMHLSFEAYYFILESLKHDYLHKIFTAVKPLSLMHDTMHCEYNSHVGSVLRVGDDTFCAFCEWRLSVEICQSQYLRMPIIL